MVTHGDYWLRAIEREDLSWLKDLRNQESTWSMLGNFVLLNDVMQEQWLEKMTSRSDQDYYVFGHKKDSIGVVRITDIDRINRSMCVGGDIRPEFRGKGHATGMYELLFKLGFDIWGMHRLWLLVLDNNKVGRHIYEKMGFKEEGVMRSSILRNGEFHDYVMMSILENEYEKHTPKS